jgi:hypothetical protein
MEEIAGMGIQRGNFSVEYDSHFLRNPDFTDHTWHPERNVISAVMIGWRVGGGTRSLKSHSTQ